MGVVWAWRGDGAGQDSVAMLGATWSAWFFPTLPSLHGVMNGFLLVCGRGPSLKSILTKAQNTHPSRPASQPACVLSSEHSQPPVHLLQTGAVSVSQRWLKWEAFPLKHKWFSSSIYNITGDFCNALFTAKTHLLRERTAVCQGCPIRKV